MAPLETRIQKRLHVSLYALLFLTVLLGLSVVLEGCTDSCEMTGEYVYFEPVYTPLEEIRASVEVKEAQPLNSVGKIYFKDNFLFVNEPGEGIHIIDNADPRNPVFKKFISIPGNVDLAVNNDILYADSYIDLLALDISNLDNIRIVGRANNTFDLQGAMDFFYPEKGVLTSWEEKSINIGTAGCDVTLESWGGFYYREGIALSQQAAAGFNSKAAIAPGTGSGSGLGGSLARMTISAGHLYLLNGPDLKVMDISTPQNPSAMMSLPVSWDIETIFPYEDMLFIGARSGMHILDISVPEAPSHISTYQHFVSCDPVVVADGFAYVTLRTGNNTCTGQSNQLHIIDVSNPQSPQLIAAYEMTNPHGLGIDDKLLFVCDGNAGLKVFDVTDKLNIGNNMISEHSFIHAFDVIPYQDVLMLVGEDGIIQYDYSNKKQLKVLSHIKVPA